jgi:hypothetical protein
MRQYFVMRQERMEAAISEIQQLISAKFPNTSYTTAHQDDPAGIQLIATVDTEDTDAVVNCFIDRLLELQVDDGLPLYVIPIRPARRVATQSQSPHMPFAAQ